MRLMTIPVLIIFVAMALASFVIMDMQSGSFGSAQCIASKIHNGECPPEDSLFALATFHTTAFQAFSLAVLITSVLFFAILSSRYLAVALLKSNFFKDFVPAMRVYQNEFSSSQEYLRFVSRFELSPSTY